MDDAVKKAATELKNAIDSESLIREYNLLAKEIAESCELQEMEIKLKQLQKDLCKTLDASLDKMHEEVKIQYQELKEAYEKHPLVNNYQNIKEQVEKLLDEIKDILNDI